MVPHLLFGGTNGNPGDLTLTTSGTTLTLSGTVDPLLAITDTTNYDFVITLLGDESNCIPLTQTGTITVSLGPSLSLDTASTTVEQSLCLGETPDNITYSFGGSAVSVYDPVWKKNGMTSEKPSWVAYNRETSGKFTLQASAIAEVIDVITVYEYELETSNSAVGTSACIEDTKKGYYILFPDAQLFSDADYGSTDFATEAEICEGDYVNNKIYFKSTSTINVSPTVSDIGLSSSVSYTSKQSFTISVSGTMSNGQTATLQFLNEDRSRALISEQWTITATENDTSSSTIAEKFKDAIDGVQPSAYEITQSNHELTISSASDGTLFGLRFLTPESLSIGVVSSTAVKGFMSLTGTITTNLVTETTVFNVEIESEGSSCSSDSLSLAYYVNPLEEIILSEGNSLNQATCYGSAITPINFSGASRYEVSWSPSQPVGISPPNGALVSPTLQISGTHSNTSGATTSYTYTLSLIDVGTNCITSDTVTGTLTFYPRADLSISSGTDSQTLCTGGEITPIIYDLSSGYNNSTYEVGWSSLPTPEGLNFSYDEAESSLTLSGSVPSSVTTETVYTYTVTFTSEYSCTGTVTTGQFTVKPEQTLSLSSGIETLDQTICESTAIETISFDFGNGATEVETSGIEAIGLDVAILNQTISISGTPTIDVTVPTTYAYTISTVDIYCTPKVETGYITLLPAPEVYFTDSSISGIDLQEVSICNQSAIDEISITFKNTPGLEITGSGIPAGTDNLNASQTIVLRQETEVQISGTSSDVGEVYKIIVKPIGGLDKAFTYTTTETTRTNSQIAAALINEIASDSSTSVSATLDGGTITLFNTTSSTVFSTKTIVTGQASMTALSTQAVQGLYVISGTVSLSSDISSFTLNLQSVDSSGDSICTLDTISVKFNLNDAPSVSVAETTTQYNYQVCDGTTVVLDFDYNGEQTSISAADITWSPENPGFDLITQVGTNSFTLSGDISKTVTQTTTYEYTITTNGSTCSDIEFSGSIDLLPQQLITHVDGTVNYLGGSSIAEGNESQTICDGNQIVPIAYKIEGGSVSHTLTWTTSKPGGISEWKTGLPAGGYSLTISGTVETNVTEVTTFEYTIETVGTNCTSSTRVGALIVRPKPLLNLVGSGTNYQVGVDAVCNLSSSDAVIYQYGGSTISTEINWTGSTGAMPGAISRSYDSNLDQETYIFNPSTTNSDTVVYEYSISSVSQYGCTPQTTLFGSIEVLPSVTILEDYIRSNDITHVSCPGGTDGSIIIPASPESEFMKRIYGGQNAVAQVVSVTLLASDTLEQDDIVRLVVDGVTYSAIVPADTTSNSILQELANEINNGNAQVNTAIAEGTLLLTASTPGISFTTSAVIISSNVTGTIVASTVVSNVSLDFSFEWRKNNEVVGNTMNLTNQAAGSYELTVSINGCATSSATFEIAEPSNKLFRSGYFLRRTCFQFLLSITLNTRPG